MRNLNLYLNWPEDRNPMKVYIHYQEYLSTQTEYMYCTYGVTLLKFDIFQ